LIDNYEHREKWSDFWIVNLQVLAYVTYFVSLFTGLFIHWSISAKSRFRSNVVNVLAARVCITFACYIQFKCIIRSSWLCFEEETPAMVWIAKLSFAPFIDIGVKELGAVLMIGKFIMY
jgi:hypothetical protein